MLTQRPGSQKPGQAHARPHPRDPERFEPRFWQLPQEPPAPDAPPIGRWRQASEERYITSADTPKAAWQIKSDLDAALHRRGFAQRWRIEVRRIEREAPFNDVWHLYAVAKPVPGEAPEVK